MFTTALDSPERKEKAETNRNAVANSITHPWWCLVRETVYGAGFIGTEWDIMPVLILGHGAVGLNCPFSMWGAFLCGKGAFSVV